METSLLLTNLLSPPVLFFVLGIVAALVKSDLEIPHPLPRFFALYLLLSIGFKGGVGLNHSGLSPGIGLTIVAALIASVIVPLYTYPLLKRRLGAANAAGVAATYGSISAVTFVTAQQFLERVGLSSGGYMVAIMALMESPAIIIAIILHSRNRTDAPGYGHGLTLQGILHEALFNGSVFLLLGSLMIGVLTGERGDRALSPFTSDVFQGFLSLFLLDMGISSAKRLNTLRAYGVFPVLFALLVPLINAALGIALAYAIGLPRGDALIFTVLCASASYIAVPAAMKMSVPDADPALFVPMALAITFPFNVAIGVPLYLSVVNALWGAG